MGNIRPHMDEHYIRSMLYAEPDVKNVKSVRDKLTGGIGQYCFVEFTSHQVRSCRVLVALANFIASLHLRAFVSRSASHYF